MKTVKTTMAHRLKTDYDRYGITAFHRTLYPLQTYNVAEGTIYQCADGSACILDNEDLHVLELVED